MTSITYMDKFTRGGRNGGFKGGFRGGGKKFGGRGFNKGGADRGPATMHAATCSSCHKACEVPFRPTGEKPVYCRDCFAGRAAMGGDRSDRPDRRERRDFKSPGAYSTPSTSQSNGGNIDELKKQLEGINTKLEKLISSVYNLSQTLTTEPVVESAPLVKEVTTKKASKKK